MAKRVSEEGFSEPQPESQYQVGYGRPPLHTRFQPGRSGNEKGRPAGSQNHSTIIRRVALRRVSTGRTRNIDIVIEAVRRGAANGHPIGLSLVRKYTGAEHAAEPSLPKGVLITGEKLTQEEWEQKYAHLG
jgi:uncharacterized protein DUF5681